MLFDWTCLGFGLGNGILRPALKISADGCCSRLMCGCSVVEWGSVEGVVSSYATEVVLVEVGLERLMGMNVEGYGVLSFLVFAVGGRMRGWQGLVCLDALGEVLQCT